MITDKIKVVLKHKPEEVFDFIDHVYNKFPVHPLLDAKPILFLRLAILDGMSAAWKIVSSNTAQDGTLTIGQSMGPFTLCDHEKPSKYLFNLNSKLFSCKTGYEIEHHEKGSILYLNLYTDSDSNNSRFVWFCIKPIHRVFSKLVLRNIKNQMNKATLF